MSEIKVNIKDRVEWLSKRINLEGYQKDYITFQMKEAVREALEQVKNNDLLHSVVGSYDHCNIVDVATSKIILTTPANRFEVKFIDADKEVGKIQI